MSSADVVVGLCHRIVTGILKIALRLHQSLPDIFLVYDIIAVNNRVVPQ